MSESNSESSLERREFLAKSTALCTIFGAGCTGLLSFVSQTSAAADQSDQHKFQQPAGFSYEKLFSFTFRNWFISYMQQLQKQIGTEKFNALLKKAGNEHYSSRVRSNFEKIKDKSVQSLIENFWEPVQKSGFGSAVMTIDIKEKLPDKGTVKMTECLFAKTFTENNAGNIGYAAICHADFAVTNEFNPDIKLTRNKCLMNGDKCCLFEYSLSV